MAVGIVPTLRTTFIQLGNSVRENTSVGGGNKTMFQSKHHHWTNWETEGEKRLGQKLQDMVANWTGFITDTTGTYNVFPRKFQWVYLNLFCLLLVRHRYSHTLSGCKRVPGLLESQNCWLLTEKKEKKCIWTKRGIPGRKQATFIWYCNYVMSH